MEGKSINNRLENIENFMDIIANKKKLDKKKPFKLKWKVKSQLKNLAKKGKIMVVVLGTNRNIKPEVAKIQDGLIVINGKYHACSMDYIYLWEGKYPTIVLPEWSLEPIGTQDYYKHLEEGKVGVDAQSIIIRAIESNQNKQGQKLSSKAMIWIFVGAIVVGYVLFANGG